MEDARAFNRCRAMSMTIVAVQSFVCDNHRMAKEEQNDTPPVRNSLARALARWDNEGGALGPEPDEAGQRAVLAKEEEHILQCLGAAVIAQWNDLPTGIQRLIFEHAISMGDPRHSVQLKSLIARFLHHHKDDASIQAGRQR